MTPELTDDATASSIASIQRYFAEELELDIGDLKARLVLEFFLKEIGASVYNKGVADAQTFLRDKLADVESACYAEEFAYWPKASVRRGRS